MSELKKSAVLKKQIKAKSTKSKNKINKVESVKQEPPNTHKIDQQTEDLKSKLNDLFRKYINELESNLSSFLSFSSELMLFLDSSKEVKINCKLNMRNFRSILLSFEGQTKSILVYLQEILMLINTYCNSYISNKHLNFILKQIAEPSESTLDEENSKISLIDSKKSQESIHLERELESQEHLWLNLMDDVFYSLSDRIITSFQNYFAKYEAFRTKIEIHFTHTHGYFSLKKKQAQIKNEAKTKSKKDFANINDEIVAEKSQEVEISCLEINECLQNEFLKLNKLRKNIYLSSYASLFQIEHQFLDEMSKAKLKLGEFVYSCLNKE